MNRFINTRLTVDNSCFAPEFPSSSDNESSPDSNKENNIHESKPILITNNNVYNNSNNDNHSQRSLSLWSTVEKPNNDMSIPVSVKQAKLCFENLANQTPSNSRPAFQRRSKLPENTHVSCRAAYYFISYLPLRQITFNVRHSGYVTLNPA